MALASLSSDIFQRHFIIFMIRTFAAACLALCWMVPVAAQDNDLSDLRALQAEQFDALYQRPDDLKLMFTYALTSIRLKDYEAAISTFDRMLIFDPNQPRVVVELAAAYFRIGSYPIARFYFTNALEDPNTPPELIPRINEFMNVIDTRTRKSYFTGTIGLSSIVTTNANKGPDDVKFELFDPNTNSFEGAFAIDQEDTSQSDVGFSASAQISHFYDLGGTNEDHWRSDLALFTSRFASTSSGAVDVLLLRTGPRLALDDERFGLKGRPFVEFDYVRSSNDALYTTIGLGLQLSDTIIPDLNGFADLRLSWRDYFKDGGDQDGDGNDDLDSALVRFSAGATSIVGPQLSVRGNLTAEYEHTDFDSERSLELGIGGSAFYRYDSGLEIASRDWALTAAARASHMSFFNSPRRDIDLRLGLSHTAYVSDGFALVAKIDYFQRNSNVAQNQLDSLSFDLGIQFRF